MVGKLAYYARWIVAFAKLAFGFCFVAFRNAPDARPHAVMAHEEEDDPTTTGTVRADLAAGIAQPAEPGGD